MQKLGFTDLQVSDVCYGTCTVSLTLSEPEFFHLLDRYVEAGGNFLDTANVYGKWEPWFDNLSEQRIGRWLASRKKQVIVATKGAHYDLQDPTHAPRVHEQAVRADLEESLKTLGLDTIDFYWLHRDDPNRPMGEILEMMETLRKEGKLRWYGASNFTAARLQEACTYAQQHGFEGFAAVSNQWSLAQVTPGANNNPDPTLVMGGPDEEAFHVRTKLPCVPFQATARGWFAKVAAGQPVSPEVTRAFDNPANRATLAFLQQRAAETGHSVQALAVAELTRQPYPVVPITSASNDAQMETLLESMQLIGKMKK